MRPPTLSNIETKEVMAESLFPRFADIIRRTARFDLADETSGSSLLLEQTEAGGKQVRMLYAPFDHINPAARVAIVGMTPGAHQAQQALSAARQALLRGSSFEEAARIAKSHASFSGEPMRTNLVRMMDSVGIARFLGLSTTRTLWEGDSQLVHFTSALRYPVFVDGRNWSGTPDIVRTAKLREWLVSWTGAELARLRECLIVPLGPKVAAAMNYLATQGLIDADRIMDGMPHPSGANQERVASFLGDKPAERCSSKTNPVALAAAKTSLIEKIGRLQVAPRVTASMLSTTLGARDAQTPTASTAVGVASPTFRMPRNSDQNQLSRVDYDERSHCVARIVPVG